jgi:hypothetical protein
MTELIDEVGPVGWLVVEFPGSRFNSEIPLTISTACLFWENRWAARSPRPFAAPAASSLSTVAFGAGKSRPTPCNGALKKKESDMPLATRRMARASVNGRAPVARTATMVATAAVVGSSRTDRFMDEIETRA